MSKDKTNKIDEVLCEICLEVRGSYCDRQISPCDKSKCSMLQKAKQQLAEMWNEKLEKLKSLVINKHDSALISKEINKLKEE